MSNLSYLKSKNKRNLFLLTTSFISHLIIMFCAFYSIASNDFSLNGNVAWILVIFFVSRAIVLEDINNFELYLKSRKHISLLQDKRNKERSQELLDDWINHRIDCLPPLEKEKYV